MRKTPLGLMAAAAAAAGMMSPVFYAEKRGSAAHPMFRYPKSPKLNRSNKWPYAKTYEEARAMSPFPNKPVR